MLTSKKRKAGRMKKATYRRHDIKGIAYVCYTIDWAGVIRSVKPWIDIWLQLLYDKNCNGKGQGRLKELYI